MLKMTDFCLLNMLKNSEDIYWSYAFNCLYFRYIIFPYLAAKTIDRFKFV